MLSDLRFAVRQLTRSPGFAVVSLITLALGLGLNTSMFSLMNLLILKPLPYPASEQLVRIYRTTPQNASAAHSASDYLELSQETAPFTQIACFRMWGYTLTPEGQPPANLNALRVSASFLPTLGLKPALGRWFTPEEDQPGNHVVILSYDTWQAHFGGDPGVIGRAVRIDGEATTIVGVMPADFSSVFLWGPADALRPMGFTADEKRRLDEMELGVIARRAAGVSLAQLAPRLATLARHFAEIRPPNRREDGLRAVSLAAIVHNPATTAISWLMLGLAIFVLLIVCANLANLQLARAVARAHEFAIRAALGASKGRLIRPLLVESLLLSAGGGLLAILIAVWTNDWISSRLSANGLFRLSLELDWRVMTFAFGVALFAGLVFGIVPAWRVSQIQVNDTLKTGSRGATGDRTSNRVQQSLIVSQFANALILLAGAGGFIRGVDRLVTVNPGWAQASIAQAVLNLPAAKYPTPEESLRFYTNLEERLRALPGVENATVAWTLPVFQYLTTRPLVVDGRPPAAAGHEPVASIDAVSPSYLATLGVPLQSGRNFTAADDHNSVRVAIINDSLARALFPGEDPIGRRIGNPDAKNPGWIQIVGVVPDVGLAVGAVPQTTKFLVLRPLAQETWNYATVAVRTAHPDRIVEPLRQTIAAMDPDLAIQQLGTIKQVTSIVTGGASMLRSVLVGFAALGLFLAALGIYGIVARIVVRRTPEIGVRIALGASAADVVRMILFSGLRLALLGTAIGLVGALGLGWLIRHLSSTATPPDPLLFVAVTSILIGVGLLACWLPARRAAGVDPMTALRAE